MAHGDDVRRRVRAAYIFDQLALPAAAAAHTVPDATAARWKREARAAGDDWDRARAAQMIAGGGIEDVVRQTLAVVVQQVQATVETIQAAPDMAPVIKVDMLASLADAYNKLMAASRRLMPQTDVLAVRLDTLKRLAEFVRVSRPAAAGPLIEALDVFGRQLADE